MKATNHNQTFTAEELTYFVDRYINNVKRQDVNSVLEDLAFDLGRTKGSMVYLKAECLSITSNGERGCHNYNTELPQVLESYAQAENKSFAYLEMMFE